MEDGTKKDESGLVFRYSFVNVVFGGVSAALVGAICYWAPYIVGKTYVARRDSMLNIPSGLFANTAEDYFAYSYYAMLTVVSNFSEFLLGDFRRTAYIAGFSCFFVMYGIFIAWFSKSSAKTKFVEKVEKRRALKAPFFVVLLSAMLTVFISLAPAFFVSIFVVPGFVGAQAALIFVEEEKSIYKKGCLVSNKKKWQCSRLIRSGEIVAEGFLIASSKDWLAVRSGGVTKVQAANGLEIESGGYAWEDE